MDSGDTGGWVDGWTVSIPVSARVGGRCRYRFVFKAVPAVDGLAIVWPEAQRALDAVARIGLKEHLMRHVVHDVLSKCHRVPRRMRHMHTTLSTHSRHHAEVK